MPLDTVLDLKLAATLTSALDLNTSTNPLQYAKTFGLPSGTGANQADRIFHDRRTIAISGTDDLDLAGVLTDPFGALLTFVKVRGILVFAGDTTGATVANTNNVVIGNAAATQFLGGFGAAAHTYAVKPGGLFLVVAPDSAGYPVGAGASDLLRIANSGAGTSVVYEIVILGTSA